MKRATVYRRKSQFFVHASSRTTDGVWILSEPCVAIAESCDDREFGAAICAALDGSRDGVPHPRNWTGLLDPLLRLAAVKSWRTFAKTAACVEIEKEGETVSVIPTRNLGADQGFQAEPSGAAAVNGSMLPDVGATVRRLLEVSES